LIDILAHRISCSHTISLLANLNGRQIRHSYEDTEVRSLQINITQQTQISGDDIHNQDRDILGLQVQGVGVDWVAVSSVTFHLFLKYNPYP
jgi:hypothetical protein